MTKPARMIQLLEPYEFSNVKAVREQLQSLKDRLQRANMRDYEHAAFVATSAVGDLMSTVEDESQ